MHSQWSSSRPFRDRKLPGPDAKAIYVHQVLAQCAVLPWWLKRAPRATTVKKHPSSTPTHHASCVSTSRSLLKTHFSAWKTNKNLNLPPPTKWLKFMVQYIFLSAAMARAMQLNKFLCRAPFRFIRIFERVDQMRMDTVRTSCISV